MLEATDIDEFEVVNGDSRVYVRREPGRRQAVDVAERAESAPREGVAIAAPLTGVYYPRASPDEPPFVSPGTIIAPGQIVALIETMKLFNEVTADLGGEVLSIVVQQGDLVEAGQPLMYVRPEEVEAPHG
jgi:acetyl-CoA carboxylase biotin carboxyl carrier protein